MTLLLWTVHILFIPALSPFFIGLTRTIKARFQNRTGASPLQPYRDLWKLFHKDEVVSADASWIFRTAPYVVFGSTLAIAASIPLFSTALQNSYTGDFLAVVYLIALGTFFLALSGMDTGSAFGGFGASREMMISAFGEGGLLLSLLVLALMSGTTDLSAIVTHMRELPLTNLLPAFLALVSFAIAMLAETARYPFDNPATHLELTMIHEAMLLEYSGPRLALMEWAAANKYLIFLTLGSMLFFPFGASLFMTLVKDIALCAAVAALESSIAKLRIFRLPDLLFTSFIIAIIALGLAL